MNILPSRSDWFMQWGSRDSLPVGTRSYFHSHLLLKSWILCAASPSNDSSQSAIHNHNPFTCVRETCSQTWFLQKMKQIQKCESRMGDNTDLFRIESEYTKCVQGTLFGIYLRCFSWSFWLAWTGSCKSSSWSRWTVKPCLFPELPEIPGSQCHSQR